MEQTSVMVITFLLLFFTLLASVQGITRDGMEGCSVRDIAINQGPTQPDPSGIPRYWVEIINECSTGCAISNIHVTCGAFSSATLVDPNVFKRLALNDCLVNNGKPLPNGAALSFRYANTYPYTLKVSSLSC